MIEKDGSGLVAYDEIREKYPLLPIILLTTLGDMLLPYFENKIKLIEILEKPVLPERLIAAVSSRLF